MDPGRNTHQVVDAIAAGKERMRIDALERPTGHRIVDNDPVADRSTDDMVTGNATNR